MLIILKWVFFTVILFLSLHLKQMFRFVSVAVNSLSSLSEVIFNGVCKTESVTIFLYGPGQPVLPQDQLQEGRQRNLSLL